MHEAGRFVGTAGTAASAAPGRLPADAIAIGAGAFICKNMNTMVPVPDPDPRPQPPEQPGPNECCGSGCPICVLDLYAEELARYRQALQAWRQRHPDAQD